jgi:tRNA pseudouridine38-40 synthase
MTLFDDDSVARAPEVEARSRVRLTVAYDGTGFSGFSVQPGGVKTVGGALAEAIQKVLKHPVKFVVAGRTDAGVHAWGNVCHFDSPLSREELEDELPRLQRALNKMLKPKIVVRTADVAPDGFDARFSALARRYRYTVLNRDVPDPFRAGTSWQVEEPLDLRAMQLACDPLIGEHDFSSFCRKPPDPSGSNVRRLHDARWLDLGDGVLRFDVEASSFCQQMVRSIVGTMVEVGLGKKRAGDLAWIIRSQDRSLAGQLAPPHGLCLWEVVYP